MTTEHKTEECPVENVQAGDTISFENEDRYVEDVEIDDATGDVTLYWCDGEGQVAGFNTYSRGEMLDLAPRETTEVRPDGPETPFGGLIGQEPY